jgi:hypothetical protein
MNSLLVYLIYLTQLSFVFCIENYYLKWFQNETKFPIIFSHQTSKPDNYIWYKHFEKTYADKLSDNSYKSEINSNNGLNVLKILNFNFNTTDQLDHYRLRLKKQILNSDEDSFIFTLAYLKDFYISVHEDRNHLNATCIAKVSIPLGVNEDHTLWLSDQIQTNVELNFDIIDPNSKVDRRRRKREVRRSSSFDRLLMNIKFEGVPIIQHKSSKTVSFDNLKCKLLLTSYDNSVIKESIYKFFDQPTSRFTYTPKIVIQNKKANHGNRINFQKSILLLIIGVLLFI